MYPDTTPQPTTIQGLNRAVRSAFALLAGMQLDLFTPLRDGPLSGVALAGELGVDADKLLLLLYALVPIGLLTMEGDRFANTPEAGRFLVRDEPAYMGGSHALWSDIWATYFHTAASIRTGVAQASHDFNAMPIEQLDQVIRGLHPGALAAGRALAARYDFSSHHTVADIGGGSGGLAIALTESYPALSATVVELPSVTPITRRIIAEAGATGRVRVTEADVLTGMSGERFDAGVLLHVIQIFGRAQAA